MPMSASTSNIKTKRTLIRLGSSKGMSPCTRNSVHFCRSVAVRPAQTTISVAASRGNAMCMLEAGELLLPRTLACTHAVSELCACSCTWTLIQRSVTLSTETINICFGSLETQISNERANKTPCAGSSIQRD